MQESNFWQCFEMLADCVSGTREESEANLDRLESEIREMPGGQTR
jgi:hypothetical protein